MQTLPSGLRSLCISVSPAFRSVKFRTPKAQVTISKDALSKSVLVQSPLTHLMAFCNFAFWVRVFSLLLATLSISSLKSQPVIEFRLGIRGNADVPDRNSDAWCRYINGLIHG